MELRRGVGVARVLVRVDLEGLLVVGLLDLARGRARVHAERVVERRVRRRLAVLLGLLGGEVGRQPRLPPRALLDLLDDFFSERAPRLDVVPQQRVRRGPDVAVRVLAEVVGLILARDGVPGLAAAHPGHRRGRVRAAPKETVAALVQAQRREDDRAREARARALGAAGAAPVARADGRRADERRGAEGAVVREDAHAAQGPGDDRPRRPAPGPGRGELVLRRRHAQLRRVDAHLHGGPRGARAFSSAHVVGQQK